MEVFDNVQEALLDADVVMGLRMQLERQRSGLVPSIREYARFLVWTTGGSPLQNETRFCCIRAR